MDPANNWAHNVFPVEEACLRSQLETIFNGVKPVAVKTGMLGTEYAVELGAIYINDKKILNYVLDPVMVCKGAGQALNPELNNTVAKKLLPLAEVVTPNLFEAGQLSGITEIDSLQKMKEAAKIIYQKGARHVFVKGGAKLSEKDKSLNATALDLLYGGHDFTILEAPLIKTTWTHGAGCTVSAAITSGLAIGLNPLESVKLAKKFITDSLKAGFPLNQWVGPGNPSAWRSVIKPE